MAPAPLSDPIIAAVAELFHQDRWQPSHDDLTVQFKRVGLSGADPRRDFDMIGKRKRVRGVLLYALDQNPAAGRRLVANLIGLVKGVGGFRPASEVFVGDDVAANLRDVLKAEGFMLDDNGDLRPLVLDALQGAELDRALLAYVRRAQHGATDAALVTGTGKDLLEATARRVIHNHRASYQGVDFPGTLYNAFCAAGLAAPSQAAMDAFGRELATEPRTRLSECLYLLGCTVNKLRNDQGTGHGRPFPATVSDREAKAAVEAMGLISEFLLSPERLTV